MMRLISFRYFSKAEKKKKVASYLLNKQEDEVKLPLAEAIAVKRDAAKMDTAYNPKKVEKYWSEFWQQG